MLNWTLNENFLLTCEKEIFRFFGLEGLTFRLGFFYVVELKTFYTKHKEMQGDTFEKKLKVLILGDKLVLNVRMKKEGFFFEILQVLTFLQSRS
jgi:hypothetical protein